MTKMLPFKDELDIFKNAIKEIGFSEVSSYDDWKVWHGSDYAWSKTLDGCRAYVVLYCDGLHRDVRPLPELEFTVVWLQNSPYWSVYYNFYSIFRGASDGIGRRVNSIIQSLSEKGE